MRDYSESSPSPLVIPKDGSRESSSVTPPEVAAAVDAVSTLRERMAKHRVVSKRMVIEDDDDDDLVSSEDDGDSGREYVEDEVKEMEVFVESRDGTLSNVFAAATDDEDDDGGVSIVDL